MTLYAINADTMGISQYAGVSPVALVGHNDVAYLVTSTQLNELVGTDDNGTDINAVVRTGDINFGTSSGKTIPKAYLYVLSSGAMLLSVDSSSFGQRTTREYSVNFYGEVTETQVSRVPLSRALVGEWWAFEVQNVAGGSFDLRGLEVTPIVMRRRG